MRNFMRKVNIVLFILTVLLLACSNIHNERIDGREPILLADREAPLGWVYLRIYSDSTFEFENRGLERKGKIFSGRMELISDTILFRYTDSIPTSGDRAIKTDKSILYFKGKYHESLEIKLDKLK